MALSFANGILVLDTQGQGISGRAPIDYSVNPDGTWVTNPATVKLRKNTQRRAESITIDPSGASWAIILTNQDGSTFFSATGTVATPVTFPGPFDFNGVVAKTLTSITRVVFSDVTAIEW